MSISPITTLLREVSWTCVQDRRAATALISLMLFLATSLTPCVCEAGYVFSPTQCSICGTYGEVDYYFNSLYEFPHNPNGDPDEYINNLDSSRYVWANSYVTSLEFYVSSFVTESFWDPLEYGELGSALSSLSGHPSTGWYGFASNSVVQDIPMVMRFYADGSITDSGFVLDGARACCTTTSGGSTPSASLNPGMRNSGILLDMHDVVYLKIAGQGSNEILNIAMGGTGGTDFDLYARCGALPTASVYDHRSASGDSAEFISTSQNCSTKWYIAVQSYSGRGMFNLVASYMTDDQDRYLVRAGTDFNATQMQMVMFETNLLLAARRFYGVSEGQVLARGIYLYNSSGCGATDCGGYSCDICFRDQAGTGTAQCIFAELGLPDVSIYWSYFSSYKGITHEFGHYYLCLSDEYGPSQE